MTRKPPHFSLWPLLIVLAMSGLFPLSSHGSTEQRPRWWSGVFVRKPMASDVAFHAETQLRYSLYDGGMQQTLFRAGPLFQTESWGEWGLLACYVQTGLLQEYRPTIQWLQSWRWSEATITVRNRLEYRSIRGESNTSLRDRIQLRVDLPTTPWLTTVLWNEPFLNLDRETWSGNRLLERNRAFVGARFVFSAASIELGYLNQTIPRTTATVMDHTWVTYFIF